MNKIYIGVDPGVKTGFAILNGLELTLHTLSFWDAIKMIESKTNDLYFFRFLYDLIVVIEDVTQNKPTFNRNLNYRSNSKVSQNVGQNKRDCQLIIEWCEMNGIEVIKKRPTKNSMTKLNAEVFNKITGYNGKSSQHSRDAAMLIFGMV